MAHEEQDRPSLSCNMRMAQVVLTPASHEVF